MCELVDILLIYLSFVGDVWIWSDDLDVMLWKYDGILIYIFMLSLYKWMIDNGNTIIISAIVLS